MNDTEKLKLATLALQAVAEPLIHLERDTQDILKRLDRIASTGGSLGHEATLAAHLLRADTNKLKGLNDIIADAFLAIYDQDLSEMGHAPLDEIGW